MASGFWVFGFKVLGFRLNVGGFRVLGFGLWAWSLKVWSLVWEVSDRNPAALDYTLNPELPPLSPKL